jgi:signal transduction histidine kinase/CheY-like chemotaxis protein/tetratricopeptide (TPR) repeat protein
MDLFTTQNQILSLESHLIHLFGWRRVETLLELAWYLRQSDTQKSLHYIYEANLLAPILANSGEVTAQEVQRFNGYEKLIIAESAALHAHFEKAEQYLLQSFQHFETIDFQEGLGDAYITEASIALILGDSDRVDKVSSKALNHFNKIKNKQRSLFAESLQIYKLAYSDPVRASSEITLFQQANSTTHNICVAALIAAAEGVIYGRREPSLAARYYMKSSNFALQVGMLRLSIISASNACESLQSINDLESALSTIEWAMKYAKLTKWPEIQGICSINLGAIQRQLGQIEDSRHTLEQALNSFHLTPGGINKAIAYSEFAETLVADNQVREAVKIFEKAIRIFRKCKSMDDLPHTLIRYANALSLDQQIDKSLRALSEAKNLNEVHGYQALSIPIHQALADIYSRHQLPPPTAIQASNCRIHFLEEALKIGLSIENWRAPSSLLMSLSDAWADLNDPWQALQFAKQALTTNRAESYQNALNRTVAIDEHFAIEKAHEEAKYHHIIAQAESNKAATLKEAHDTLEKLGKIGQEITTKLDTQEVFISIFKHVQSLLETTSFLIYLIDETGQELSQVFGMEQNKPFPTHTISITHPTSLSARCARERKEIIIDVGENDPITPIISGTLITKSLLFAPLIIGEKLLGVMSIQSIRNHAYGDREIHIFNTLCAYSAIALENSIIYKKLNTTQSQLLDAVQKLDIAREKERTEKEKAEHSTRLKSEFLANMSHEIRTPINAVVGMTYLVLQTELTSKQEQYITKIQHASNSLLGIINDILDFSKIEAGKLEVELLPFCLEDVLSHVKHITQQKATEKGLEYLFTLEENLPEYYLGDSLRLGQILINLCNNAIKFTDQGSVKISCTTEHSNPAPSEQIRLHIEIEDTGIGLSEEQLKLIFQDFIQADGSTTRRFGGTGLGLSISKKLVELMEGQIGVMSHLNYGSIFYINIPLTVIKPKQYLAFLAKEAQQKQISSSQLIEQVTAVQTTEFQPLKTQNYAHSNLQSISDIRVENRILLAEDNEFNQEIAMELLSQIGFSVDIANNGKEAFDLLVSRDIHHYQMILMDLEMPIMDGHTATGMIRMHSEYQSIPIIALTAHAISGIKDRCIEAGMQDYITKPFSPETLFSTVKKWAKSYRHGPAKFIAVEAVKTSHPIEEFSFHHFNVRIALDNVAQNPQLLQQLLLRFQQDQAQFGMNLIDLLKNKNCATVERELHSFGSICATLGAQKIEQKIKTIELSLLADYDQTDLDELIEEQLISLQSMIDELLKEIKLYLNTASIYNNENTSNPYLDIDASPINDVILKLIDLLETYRSEAYDYYTVHSQRLVQLLGQSKGLEFCNAISKYDYESAIRILKTVNAY